MTNRSKRNRKSSGKAATKHTQTPSSPQVMADAEWLPAGAESQLLEDARAQWQLGDWQALTRLSAKTIEAHPSRANIALLCAAAHQQLSQLDKTRELVKLSRQWGASKEQVVWILTAGVHNVLARATALSNLEDRALEHYRQAVTLGNSSSPSSYLVQARASVELRDHAAINDTARELLATAGTYVSQPTAAEINESDLLCRKAETNWCQGNWQALSRLDNAVLPNHPQRIALGIYAACGHQQIDDGEAEKRCIDLVLGWGCEKARIKRFLLSGIYNRLGKANAYAGETQEAARYFHKAFNHIQGDIPQAKQYIQQRVKSQLKDLPKEELQSLLNIL